MQLEPILPRSGEPLAAPLRRVLLALALKQPPGEREAFLAIMVKDGHLPAVALGRAA